jgi:predicted ribosomally synthesized peptide with SipW-like signal peptide
MNRKNKAIISSVCIIAASSAIIAGSTYALFTSSSSVDIAVTSGYVDVKATISDIKTYSAIAKNKLDDQSYEDNEVTGDVNNRYVYQPNRTYYDDEVYTSEFSIGGGVTYNATTNKFVVTDITPGTKITFNINIDNASSVNIKYRTSLEYTTESSLATALIFSLDDWVPTSESIKEYQDGKNVVSLNKTKYISSSWADWYTFEDTTKVIKAQIELPLNVANEYAGKKVELEYNVEAVQGNAATSGEEEQEFFIYDIASLKAALINGSIDLYQNLQYSGPEDKINGTTVEVKNNNVKLNTQGSSMSFSDSATSNTSMFTVAAGKQLTINGNGVFDATNGTNNSVATVNGTLLITGGEYYSNEVLFKVNKGGKLYISGGYFDVSSANSDNLTSAINNNEGTVKIGGGTYVDFDPTPYLISTKSYNVEVEQVEGHTVYTVKHVSGVDTGIYYYSTGDKVDEISLATTIVINDGVTEISQEAFKDYFPFVTNVKGKDTVTTVGNNAFENCTSLESIDFSDCAITSWGKGVFRGCSSLQSAYLSDSLTAITDNTFTDCYSLKSIDLSGCTNMTSIGWQSFQRCSSLTTVTLPDSLTSIDKYAFSNCTSLQSISIPDGVTVIKGQTFFHCESLTTVKFPAKLTEIGDAAFDSCYVLQSIDLPSTLTKIGGYGFNACKLVTDVVLPENLTYLGGSAFAQCYALENITIPNSVTYIGSSAFDSCRSLTYNIIDNVKYLGNDTNQKLVLVSVLDKTIEEFTIDSDTRFINNNAFEKCINLKTIQIPDNVYGIGSKAFNGCTSLESVTLASSVTYIDSYAFNGCTALTSVIIPENVTSLSEGLFAGCTGLQSVNIGANVTNIGKNVFSGCTSLQTITYDSTEEQWNKVKIDSTNDLSDVTINYKSE